MILSQVPSESDKITLANSTGVQANTDSAPSNRETGAKHFLPMTFSFAELL